MINIENIKSNEGCYRLSLHSFENFSMILFLESLLNIGRFYTLKVFVVNEVLNYVRNLKTLY